MGTLTGEKIKDKYGELLKLESEGTSTYKSVETGKAEAIGLKLSQDGIEVQGLKFTTDPSTSTSELTALLYDNTTKTVVIRDLDSTAFTASSFNIFKTVSVSGQSDIVADELEDVLTFAAGDGMEITTDASTDTVTFSRSGIYNNPTLIMRPPTTTTSGDAIILDANDLANPPTNTRSALLEGTDSHGNPTNNLELVKTTTEAGDDIAMVKVKTAGLVRIDVNLIISVLTAQTDITVKVYKEDTVAPEVIQDIVREHSPVNKTAIGFSLFHVATANDMYYYTIQVNHNVSVLNASTFTVTKLT